MRHRLTLHRTVHPASDFEPDSEVTEQVAEIYASIETKGGKEENEGGSKKGLTSVTIKTRWGVSIASADSSWWAERVDPITDKVRRYNFASVVNEDERNKWLIIEAVERG